MRHSLIDNNKILGLPFTKGLLIPFFFYSIFVSVGIFSKYNTFDQSSYIWSDSEGYYMYLPVWFIYGNYADVPIRTIEQFPKLENGNFYNKYSAGIAVLQMPFFVIIHGVNTLFEIDHPDGYSRIYNYMILWASLSYCFFGLFVIFNYIKTRFDSKTALITVLCVYFGTNLNYYTINEAGMSHAYSFGLIAFTIIRFLTIGKSVFDKIDLPLFFVICLIIWIRPLNILILLYPILLVFFEDGFKNTLVKIIRRPMVLLVGLLMVLSVFVFNFYEWSRMSGTATLYSYGDEGFNYWYDPKILRVLFDIQNGLFIYAPILLFGIYIIIRDWNKKTEFKIFGLILLTLSYFFGSWWAWWFGGAYGHRCYVDHLILFAIPIAIFIKEILDNPKRYLSSFQFSIVFLLIYYSIRMTILYDPPWDGDDWNVASYLDVFAEVFFIY